jgi:hypothetical protein
VAPHGTQVEKLPGGAHPNNKPVLAALQQQQQHNNMKSKAKKSVTKPTVSVSSRARELGISRQAMQHLLTLPDAPELDAPIEDWEMFRAAHGRDDRGGSSKLRESIGRQRLRINTGLAEKIERENAVKKGQLIDFAEVTRFITRLVGHFFGEWDRIATSYPNKLRGLNEAEMSAQINADAKQGKETLRSMLDSWESGVAPSVPADTDSADAMATAKTRFEAMAAAEKRWRECQDPTEKENLWFAYNSIALPGVYAPFATPAADNQQKV